MTKYRGLPGNEDYNELRRKQYKKNKIYIREQIKEARYIRGDATPMEINKDCTASLGVDIGEHQIGDNILKTIFDKVDKMEYRNHMYDFICKNPKEFILKYPQFRLEKGKEYRIDVKTRCLSHNSHDWSFKIDYNTPDYFLLLLIDNRQNLDLLHSLLIHKHEEIRGDKLYKREYLTITNKSKRSYSLLVFDLKKIDIINTIITNIHKELIKYDSEEI